jgi:hypothetical protein
MCCGSHRGPLGADGVFPNYPPPPFQEKFQKLRSQILYTEGFKFDFKKSFLITFNCYIYFHVKAYMYILHHNLRGQAAFNLCISFKNTSAFMVKKYFTNITVFAIFEFASWEILQPHLEVRGVIHNTYPCWFFLIRCLGLASLLECGRFWVRSHQVKAYTEIGIWCFSAKNATLRSKGKDLLTLVPKWSDMSVAVFSVN